MKALRLGDDSISPSVLGVVAKDSTLVSELMLKLEGAVERLVLLETLDEPIHQSQSETCRRNI